MKILQFPGTKTVQTVAAPVQTVAPQIAPPATKKPAIDSASIFSVDAKPISSEHGVIPGKKGIFVGNHCVNIVSKSYEIHQPSEILEAFESVAAKSGLSINRIVTNPENGGLLIGAKYGDCKVMNESHDINLSFYTSHCGKYKTFLTLDLLRIACMNQVPVLYKNKERHIISEKHYRHALDIAAMQRCIEGIPDSIAAFSNNAEVLQQKSLSFSAFLDLYVKHYKQDTAATRWDSKVQKLREIYFSAPGQKGLKDTGYKAFQAITFANTHDLRETKYKNETVIGRASDDSLAFMRALLAA